MIRRKRFGMKETKSSWHFGNAFSDSKYAATSQAPERTGAEISGRVEWLGNHAPARCLVHVFLAFAFHKAVMSELQGNPPKPGHDHLPASLGSTRRHNYRSGSYPTVHHTSRIEVPWIQTTIRTTIEALPYTGPTPRDEGNLKSAIFTRDSYHSVS